MTVIKSLESYHGYDVDDDDCSDSHYFTEHDVHGNVVLNNPIFKKIIFLNCYSAQRLQLELQQHIHQSSRSAPPSPSNVSAGGGNGLTVDSRRPRRRDRWRGTFRIRKLSGCKQS